MRIAETLLQAIGITAELTATELSKPAIKAMAMDLSAFPEQQILKALTRCRRELKPRQFTVSEVIARIDDGRPGPEEAWGMVPKDEGATVVWNDEICEAWAIAAPLMDSPIQARMAFLEKYRELVREGRELHRPVRWWATLGHDPLAREAIVLQAVEKGRLTQGQAIKLLPAAADPAVVQRIEALGVRALESR